MTESEDLRSMKCEINFLVDIVKKQSKLLSSHEARINSLEQGVKK